MSGLFGTLDVSTRGLFVTQNGVRVASHNISNVETPGFTRQRQVLAAGNAVGFQNGAVGTGVEQLSIQRISDELLFRQLTSAGSGAAALDVEAGALERIEEVLNEQHGDGLGAQLSALFDAFGDLASATAPGAPVERESLRSAAVALIDTFSSSDGRLREIMSEADRSAVATLDVINGISREIGSLNGAIVRDEAIAPANDLRDRRDELVRELSALVEVSTFEQAGGSLVVMIADGLALVDGGTTRSLSAEPDTANPFDPSFSRIVFDTGAVRLDVTNRLGGGQLGGQIEVRDALVPSALQELDVLAFNLTEQVNAVHTGGTGLDGTVGNFFAALPAVVGAAGSLALDPDVAARADAIAAGLTAAPGDNRNALALADLRTTPAVLFLPGDPPGTPSGPSRTLIGQHAFLVSRTGETARVTRSAQASQARVLGELEQRRDSISGVSLDEEMIRLIRLEAAFQANARVISTVDHLLETVLQIL